MITETILAGFQTIVTVVLSIIPSLPAMPTGIEDALNNIVDIINDVVGLIAYIYTPVFLLFIFAMFLAIIGFDFVYKFVLWVLHKVRG